MTRSSTPHEEHRATGAGREPVARRARAAPALLPVRNLASTPVSLWDRPTMATILTPRAPVALLGLLASLGVPTVRLAAQSAADLPFEFHHDFRSAPPPPEMAWSPSEAVELVRQEPEGLRLTIPATWSHPWGGMGYWSSFDFGGDFEITVAFEILQADAPARGNGVGIVLHVVGPGGQASLGRLTRSGNSEVLLWEHSGGEETSPSVEGTVACLDKVGRMRLKRVGTTLYYQWSPTLEGGAFEELHRLEFGDGPVARVRLGGVTGRQQCKLDVRLLDFRIRSQSSELARPMGAQRSGWRLVVVSGLVLAIALGRAWPRGIAAATRAGKELGVDRSAAGAPSSPVAMRGVAAGAAPARPLPFLVVIAPCALLLVAAYCGGLTANLISENFNVARALVDGRGYADAIGAPVGPTAWNAPVYPFLQAALLLAGDGSRDFVRGGLVALHLATLVATCVLVLALARQTTRRVPMAVAAILFLLVLAFHFWNWFQVVQDCWIMLLALDVLVAGFCWANPLDSRARAAGWGLVGGLCALTNPGVGLAWAVLSLVLARRRRAWSRAGIALLCAALALSPWVVRNYAVFGRFIPVKSNLAYELYQSQCLQADGLLESTTARLHPSTGSSRERQEFQELGESAYLAKKSAQFRAAVRADPVDFLDRVATRFLGATLWYVPFDRAGEAGQPWLLWARRLVHPLPFLAFLVLLLGAARSPLSWPQWAVLGTYGLYLLPYVVVSYYERYAVPLDALEMLLMLWAAERMLARGRLAFTEGTT